jgi:hypothetical protein
MPEAFGDRNQKVRKYNTSRKWAGRVGTVWGLAHLVVPAAMLATLLIPAAISFLCQADKEEREKAVADLKAIGKGWKERFWD